MLALTLLMSTTKDSSLVSRALWGMLRMIQWEQSSARARMGKTHLGEVEVTLGLPCPCCPSELSQRADNLWMIMGFGKRNQAAWYETNCSRDFWKHFILESCLFWTCIRGSYKGFCSVETIFNCFELPHTSVTKQWSPNGDLLEYCDMKTRRI